MTSAVKPAAAPTPVPAPLSRKLHKEAQRMLEQQCWCWGQDIKRPAGNLLIEYGMTRTRPAEGIRGSNTYVLRLEGGELVALWGFGVFYGAYDEGGLFVDRIKCAPRLWPAPEPPLPVWEPPQFALARVPTSPADSHSALVLLARLMSWIAGYERWIMATAGEAYRQETIALGASRRLQAADMAPNWDRLAQQCDELGAKNSVASGR